MSQRFIVMPAFVITIILSSCAFVAAQPAPAGDGPGQQMQQPMPPPPDDPFADAMFPPEMIMQHARELNLTPEQKTFMRDEIQKTTTRFNDLQWQLQDAMEALHETMKANQVNEQQALAQLNKVLDAERDIKTLHMGMAIRIKNKLTPEQQMKLQTMRNMMGQPRGPRRGQPGGPDGPARGPRPGPGGPGPGGPGGGPRPGGRPGGPPNF
ncbi:MAG: Spy/CpxP family protein refolding chaperone [Pyrinomonadaceae bacterium]